MDQTRPRRRISRRPRTFKLAVGLALFVPVLIADPTAGHIRNFGKVDSRLYRGAAPSLQGLKDLADGGIAFVIDLRQDGAATVAERNEVQRLGMAYANIPLPAFSAPPQDKVQSVLRLLLAADHGPVFLHCRRGKDRTGTIVACYRIQREGWTNRSALQEASAFGMSSAERGMRSFVMHFTSFPELLFPVRPPVVPLSPIQR